MLESGPPPIVGCCFCCSFSFSSLWISLSCALRTSGADCEGIDTGGGERLRFDTMEGLRSADVARLCSGSGGTSRSLSLISLCMRLNVRGRGSPGTTFLLPLLCSSPPLDCGLSFSLLPELAGRLFVGDDGSSSSRFSQLPILLKLRRFHMLLFAPTSVLALCRLRSRLVPPFSAAGTWGIFECRVSHTHRSSAARCCCSACNASRLIPSILA